jgi:hypothetical protein
MLLPIDVRMQVRLVVWIVFVEEKGLLDTSEGWGEDIIQEILAILTIIEYSA